MGTIRKRRKVWYVDYYYKGKRHIKAISKHKRLDELALKDIEVKIAKKEYLGVQETGKTLFSSFGEKYLDYSKANKSDGSHVRDATNINHLNKYFGKMYLHEIKPEMIEKYKVERLEKVTPASVNRELSTLKHLYTMAIRWGYAPDSPAKTVRLFKEPPGRTRYLEKDEIKKLLNECVPHLKAIVITALNTGMRRGELLNLQWQDIDLHRQVIKVRNSKNNTSRVIPINDKLLKTLREIPKENEFVFTWNGNGIKNVKTAFRKAEKKADIKDFRFHDLRHTFASYLAMSDCNLKTIQELMGHKDIKMTMKYSHLSGDSLKNAVQKLVTIW